MKTPITHCILIAGGSALGIFLLVLFFTPTTTNEYTHEDIEMTPEADTPDLPDASSDERIVVTTPGPNARIESPLTISGSARGTWYFEASFPLILTDWDGLIIAESYATADGDWMTEEFVPFTGTLVFESPFQTGDPEYMRRGSLIIHKANPSGLPQHDAAIEIPVTFSPTHDP